MFGRYESIISLSDKYNEIATHLKTTTHRFQLYLIISNSFYSFYHDILFDPFEYSLLISVCMSSFLIKNIDVMCYKNEDWREVEGRIPYNISKVKKTIDLLTNSISLNMVITMENILDKYLFISKINTFLNDYKILKSKLDIISKYYKNYKLKKNLSGIVKLQKKFPDEIIFIIFS